MTNIWKIICYFSFGVAVLGLAALYGYSTHYTYANPKAPEPQSGRIYPHNNHGAVVYLNEDELLTIRLAGGALIVGMIGFVGAGQLAGEFRRRK